MLQNNIQQILDSLSGFEVMFVAIIPKAPKENKFHMLNAFFDKESV